MPRIRPSRPISRERLSELAEELEHLSSIAGKPDWKAVVAVGRELVRGGRAHLRRDRRG